MKSATARVASSTRRGNRALSASARRSACGRSCRTYEDAGVDQLIIMVQAGADAPREVMQTIQLFGEEIIPAFKEKVA